MTTQSKSIAVLNDIVAVQVKFSIWTGRKKLADTDLSLNGEVPPKEIVNLGSKHTTDPSALKAFHKLKRRAERECSRIGIPFLGGVAIPAHEATNLASKLNKIINVEFPHEKQAYLARHEGIQNSWIEQFPAYTDILSKALTPVDEVEKRINASFSMFKVGSANVANVDDQLGQQVEELATSLDEDILKASNSLLDKLTNAIKPNQTNVNSLKKLREKVEGLAFLNSRFNNLVTEIKRVESLMPVSGVLHVNETNALSGLLYRMSNADTLNGLMDDLEKEDSLPSRDSTFDQPVEFKSDFEFNGNSSTTNAFNFEGDVKFDDITGGTPKEITPTVTPANKSIFF